MKAGLLGRGAALALTWAVVSCGGGGDGSQPPINNSAPQFTSAAQFQVEDDTAGVVYLATAVDAEGHQLTYSLSGGPDVSAFEITAAGSLSFAEPANFEAPADLDRDNVYNVQLRVSDGLASDTLNLVITVVDVPTPVVQGPAWSLLGRAAWTPRDSSGEAVLNGQLWIMGGWVSSFQPALRDVWTSSDGVNWTQSTTQAPWTHSDLPMSITFQERVWMMGGYDQGRLPSATASNEVWSSLDGAEWKLEGTAPWSARLGAGIVVFNNRMWVIGGAERYFDGTQGSLLNDVWYTEDGRTWRAATTAAAWSPRAFHNALAYNGRIYVFGGGNYAPEFQQYNDVWSSADGVSWRRETSRAEWLPRIWAAAVVYDNKMWLLGGHGRTTAADPSTGFNLNDVWFSTDGARWVKVLSPSNWGPRHEASAWVANDRIYVGGGFDGNALTNEVWSLARP